MADPKGWLLNFGRGHPRPPAKLVLSGSSSAPSTPGGSGVATPAWDVEKDTDKLFRDHGVEEIKKIEEQTRKDIDSRREELRQMVGEKYRDLIDAADSIVDMQKCSEQVKLSVSTMESLCQKLQQTHFLKGSGGMRGPLAKNKTHEMAAQLKILAECPERLWVCLEGRSYLKAAQHYLLARHIYSQLGLGLGGRGKGCGSGGVVQKLWQSISGFKDTILECCNRHLQCSDITEELMVQSLCAMVLLEGCSLRQAFAQFLLARKAAIQSSFVESSQHRTVKSQICHLVKTLLHSLLHIAAIFCERHSSAGKKEPSLLLQNLLQFSHKDDRGKNSDIPGACSGLISEDLLLQLPSSVAGFTPSLRSTILTEIPATDLHSATQDWITVCCADVESRVGKALQHVTSVKAISSIKAAIHALLSTSPFAKGDGGGREQDVLLGGGGGSTPWEEQWTAVCQLILSKELSIWDTFFQGVLLQRVKLLLGKRFAAVGSHASSQLSNLLNSMATNPAGYHGDIQCHSQLWREEGGPKSGGETAATLLELSLKSKSCTPAIHRFCENLGVELTGLIDDVSHYIQPPSSVTSHPATPTLSSYRSKKLDSFPFPLYADTAVLQDCIQQLTVEWIKRFVQQVDGKVMKLQLTSSEGGGDSASEPSARTIDMLLVVGRLCQCLVECCPSLSYLVTGARLNRVPLTSSRSSRHNKSGVLQQLQKEASEGAESAVNLLQERASSIFKIWVDWTASQLMAHLCGHLSCEVQLSALASSLIWNDISISEEAESGKKVSSVIQVPSQASTYITSLLFTLCQEIGHVGGHAMEREILEQLSAATLVGVVKTHEALLEDLAGRGVSIPQPCALQLWYNLKFLLSILALPDENEEEVSGRVKALLERLLAWVDPFDLDVFMPYMLANLENQLSRSSVMFGVLLAVRGSLHRLHMSSTSSSSGVAGGMGQDKHMVLPMAPMVGRIPNLPLSSKSIQQHHIHKVTASTQQDVKGTSLLKTISFFHHL